MSVACASMVRRTSVYGFPTKQDHQRIGAQFPAALLGSRKFYGITRNLLACLVRLITDR
jgi:hypothetical protein